MVNDVLSFSAEQGVRMSDGLKWLIPMLPILILIGLILYIAFRVNKFTRALRDALPRDAQTIKGFGEMVKSAQEVKADRKSVV